MPYKTNRKEQSEATIPTDTDWLTINQASAYLQINRETFRRLRQAGIVVDFKLGGLIRFSRKQIDEAVASGATKL